MARVAAGKAVLRVLDPKVGVARRGTLQALKRHTLDPFAHLEDGHITILDLVTMDEVQLVPWPHQEEITRAWIDLDHLARTGKTHPELAVIRYRNVVEEKSRQMGVTWILAYLDLWALTYHDANGLVTHLEFGKVDDGGSGSTPDSYFGKIRYMWERMPLLYRAPLTFRLGQVKHEFSALRYLIAESADPEAGRGGRYIRAVIDEAARLSYGEAANAALQRAIPDGRFYNSTPAGDTNVYARLAQRPPAGFRKLRHHWSQHPVYAAGLHVAAVGDYDERGQEQPQPDQPDREMEDAALACDVCAATRDGVGWDSTAPVSHRYPGRLTSPWYDAVICEMTDDQVATELEIDYTGQVTAKVYPEFEESVHVVETLPLDRTRPVELALDYGGHTSVVLLQDLPYEVHVIGEAEIERDAIPETVDRAIREELHRLGFKERELNRTHTLALPAVGDPAGEARQQATARSLVSDYRKLGWAISSRPRSIKTTILAARRLLLGRPKRLYISREGAPRFVEHIAHNRWPVDRAGNRKANVREPENDRHNHMMRAFAYWAAERFPPLEDAFNETDDERRAREQAELVAQIRARSSGPSYAERF